MGVEHLVLDFLDAFVVGQLGHGMLRPLDGSEAALLNALPALEHRLVAMAGDELMAAQEQIVLLGRKTARERIASFLTRLSARQVQLGGAEGRVHLPMTRLDIADYLGLTIETVSRVFTQFKTSGLIQLLPNNDVALPDPEALKALGEGAA